MYQCVETSLLAFDSRPRDSQPLPPRHSVGLTNAWENCVAKNVDSLRICRFLLSIQFGGECEKRVENTFSLLASFFIFLLLFGQLCLRFVGEEKPEEGGGQILNGFFTFRLIAPPTQPDRDSSGQLSTVIRVAFFRLFKY